MRYIVWFSWGIDSVFVWWYLKQKWNDVFFVNLKNTKEKNKCCELESNLFKISDFLWIPLKIINVMDEFKELVIEYFINSYLTWKTPNPCVNCNKFVRFKMLEEVRKQLWYDFIATGHYIKKTKIKDFYTFSVPLDVHKDQTYMLYKLIQDQKLLKYLFFPMWDYKKPDVKKILDKNKIPINLNQESQNVCFVPDDDYANFIKNYKKINIKKWKIKNLDWEVVWEHDGVLNYTIWKRKWLYTFDNQKKYVLKIDYKNNVLIVWENQDLFTKQVRLTNLFLIEPNLNYEIYWKIRYNWKLQKILDIKEDKVIFENEVRAVTPWQHLVLYWKNDDNFFVIGWWEIV